MVDTAETRGIIDRDETRAEDLSHGAWRPCNVPRDARRDRSISIRREVCFRDTVTLRLKVSLSSRGGRGFFEASSRRSGDLRTS